MPIKNKMFIVKKKIGKEEYYYLRESRRENGKVRAISIAYLGKNRKESEKKAKEIEINLKSKRKLEKEKSLKGLKVNENQAGKKIINMSDKKEIKKVGEEKDFLSFIQEAGLVWGPSPEIYGGLAGFYTYGPLGKLLKNKVENSIRKVFNEYGFREIEGPTVVPDSVWKASGHLDTFSDPVMYTQDGKESFRVDKLLEENGIQVSDFSDAGMLELVKKNKLKAPNGKEFELKIERHSLMMKTKVAGKDASLRPETATVTYLPFLSYYQYFRKKLPFGVFQIGKAYRNEISPRQHVIRGREFTQAEGQIFIDPKDKNTWDKFLEIKDVKMPFWDNGSQRLGSEVKEIKISEALKKGFVKSQAYVWCVWLAYMQFRNFGIPAERIRLRQHADDEKAFYASDAWDIEINLKNYGWTEVCGVHDRGSYDLGQHAKHSGVALEAQRENGERFVPDVLEIAFGSDRPTYALIDLFYEKKEEGEGKTTFRIPYNMAPIEVSIFPLMKKEELLEVSSKVKKELEKEFVVDYDVSGSIGKRYLRSAKAGTPFAVTIDFDSLNDESVTLRDRDSEKQIRVKISELRGILRELLSGERKFSQMLT